VEISNYLWSLKSLAFVSLYVLKLCLS
jgi:hypothetical protein